MSIFNFIVDVFKPISDTIDELHTSEEEKGLLKIKMKELQANASSKLLELQGRAIEANTKVAVAEQTSGNTLSKSWRPIAALAFVFMLVLMSIGTIPFNQFLAGIAGGFLGIYAPLRSLVDKKEGK